MTPWESISKDLTASPSRKSAPACAACRAKALSNTERCTIHNLNSGSLPGGLIAPKIGWSNFHVCRI